MAKAGVVFVVDDDPSICDLIEADTAARRPESPDVSVGRGVC